MLADLRLKKVRTVAELEDPLVVADLNGPRPQVYQIYTLQHFAMDEGNVRWRFADDRGVVYEGGLGEVALRTPVRVALAIPLIFHNRRQGLAPEFIFLIPSTLHINSLHYLRKRFPEERFSVL